MSKPNASVRYTVLCVSTIYAVLLYLSGVELDSWAKRLVGVLPLLSALLLTGWDVWAWKVPALQRLTGRPRLDGLWQAELNPTEESHIPPGGKRGPIPAYLVITQTYWSIAVRQYTGESKSDSRASFWQRSPDAAVETLAFLYENTPEQRHQARSPRHLGSCTLDSTNQAPEKMSGVYFTDRYTQGDMTMTLVDRSTGHPSFTAAEAHQPKTTRWRRKKPKDTSS